MKKATTTNKRYQNSTRKKALVAPKKDAAQRDFVTHVFQHALTGKHKKNSIAMALKAASPNLQFILSFICGIILVFALKLIFFK